MKKQQHLDHAQFSQLMAHAWKDSDFKSRLEHDPTSAIRDFASTTLGVDVEHPLHFPDRPDDLSDEHLHAAAAGDRVLGMAPKTSCL